MTSGTILGINVCKRSLVVKVNGEAKNWARIIDCVLIGAHLISSCSLGDYT